MRSTLLFLIAASLLGGGCVAAGAAHPGEGLSPSAATPTATIPAQQPTATAWGRPEAPPPVRPTAILAPPVPASRAEAEVQAAKADLARRLGVDTDAIALVRVMAWDWPNASLGVPDERLIYIPVTTPGYIIVLEAQGRQYEYHGDTHGRVVYAPQGLLVP